LQILFCYKNNSCLRLLYAPCGYYFFKNSQSLAIFHHFNGKNSSDAEAAQTRSFIRQKKLINQSQIQFKKQKYSPSKGKSH
jgi:hypothetical protein